MHFGSLAALQEQFTHIALSTRGSGWAALVWDPTITRLRPTQLRDHDVRSLRGARLLLVCDVREHATAEPAFRLLKAGLLLSGVVGAVALLGIQFATPDGSGLAQSPDDWVEAAGRGLA